MTNLKSLPSHAPCVYRHAITLALVFAPLWAGNASVAQTAYNTPGNILIADQFNNRVVEVDQNHNIVWQFGTGSTKAGPYSVVAPNDAERVGDLTLISGTGAPPGLEPQCPGGCPDNRVFLVNQAGQIVWQYSNTGVWGWGGQLSAPVCAVFLPNKHLLITDQGNQRVVDVTQRGKLVWQYGKTGVAGSGFNELSSPNSSELLPSGNILIADEGNNRVIEVNRNQQIVWQYGNPNDTNILNGPGFASRVGIGNTLITDGNNNRILEVTPSGTVVFTYYTNNRSGSISSPAPSHAVRLYNGNTLISDQINNQVIEVDPTGNIVFSQGQVNVAGTGFNQLNWPYDAKMIGDYTGITASYGSFFRLIHTLWDNQLIY